MGHATVRSGFVPSFFRLKAEATKEERELFRLKAEATESRSTESRSA
jgi:hypothetical protein